MGIVKAAVEFGAKSLLPLLVLGAGLGVGWSELRAGLATPFVRRAFFVTGIWVPLLTLAVVVLLPVRSATAGMLMLMALTPGCPFLIQTMRRSRDAERAVILVVALSLLAGVLLPLGIPLVRRLFGYRVEFPPFSFVRTVFVPIFAPLTLGLALRQWVPRLAASLFRIVSVVFPIALVVVVALLVVVGGPELFRLPLWSWIAVAAITLGSALIGDVLAGSDPKDRSLLGIAAALGNPALALFVVSHNYSGMKAGPFFAAYLLMRALFLIPFRLWLKLEARVPKSGRREASA